MPSARPVKQPWLVRMAGLSSLSVLTGFLCRCGAATPNCLSAAREMGVFPPREPPRPPSDLCMAIAHDGRDCSSITCLVRVPNSCLYESQEAPVQAFMYIQSRNSRRATRTRHKAAVLKLKRYHTCASVYDEIGVYPEFSLNKDVHPDVGEK